MSLEGFMHNVFKHVPAYWRRRHFVPLSPRRVEEEARHLLPRAQAAQTNPSG